MKDPTWSDDIDAQKAGPDAIGDKMDAAIASLDTTLDNMRETRKLRLGPGEIIFWFVAMPLSVVAGIAMALSQHAR